MASAQLKNFFTSIGELDSSVPPASLTLKIAAGNSALQYFIIANTHNRVSFYGQYALHHVAGKNELAQRISKICAKDELLQLPFGEIIIAVDTPYSLLPPSLVFMKNENQELQFCKTTGLNIAYIKPDEEVAALKAFFPKAKTAHLCSSYLEQLPAYLNENADKLFVNVHQTHFDVIRFKKGNSLLMMNRYNYKTETDLIYFLLLCCEELNINREVTELVLMGEVKKPSKIYDICYRYFLNIEFIQSPEGFTFSKDFKDYPPHLHFNLYTLTK